MENSLVGKILLAKSVHTDVIKTALTQAWKTTKEVKIESMRNNIFRFKFGLEVDKQKIMAGEPCHFDRALIVLKEPNGIENMRNEEFTHTCFWVQTHNIPIVCIERETMFKSWED